MSTDWNAEAATFDDAPDHGLADPAIRAAWRTVLRSQLPPPPARVADLGCGTGTLSVLLSAEGYAVHGVDSADEMIRRARQKARAAGVTANFIVGDVSAPPLQPESVDVVLSRHVLWAMPDPAAALERWLALLTSVGRAVLVEGLWHTGAGLSAAATLELVRACAGEATLTPLSDSELWGGPVADERYLVLARR